MAEWWSGSRLLADDPTPRVMGILNVTPDSFSDGGRFDDTGAAVEHGQRLAAEGAHIIDIGGESSRPGAPTVSLAEERRRVAPVLEALAATIQIPISIDTAKPEIAAEALRLGAAIVNDIGGLREPAMVRVVADSDAAVVIMHMAGTPQTMQINPQYQDVVTEVFDDLAWRVEAAERAGIARRRIAVDPGIGFGKRSAHNLALLRNLQRFQNVGCAVMIGTSRKSFLGAMTNRPVHDRVVSSVISAIAAIDQGARVVRVHDVAATVDAIAVWDALCRDLQRESLV